MNMNNSILDQIKTLTLESTVKVAQKVCENLLVTHLPIVENQKLVGCLSKNDIQTIENKEQKLTEYSYLLNNFYANEKTTLLDLLTLFANNDANLIPVLDQEMNYIGYFELNDILETFSDSPFLGGQSETLIVSKNKNDYSMSQIAQIVEASGGKLLGSYISSEHQDNTQITLRISIQEINEIIQTFRRYDYDIITQHENDFYLEELKNRASYLKKYLEM